MRSSLTSEEIATLRELDTCVLPIQCIQFKSGIKQVKAGEASCTLCLCQWVLRERIHGNQYRSPSAVVYILLIFRDDM